MLFVCIFCFFAHPGWNCQDCIGKPGRCLNTIRSSLAQGVWHKMEEEIIVVSRTVLCVGEATFVPSPASHAWMRPGPQRCAWCDYVGNNKKQIERHEIDHHGKSCRCPRFFCFDCGKAFESSGALRKHARHKGHRILMRYAFPAEIHAMSQRLQRDGVLLSGEPPGATEQGWEIVESRTEEVQGAET